MKKIGALLLCILLLCGCESFDYEMMVCSYHGMSSLYYEIRYSKDEIRNIVVVEYMDLREMPDDAFEERLRYLKNDANVLGYYRGIDTYLENDNREITKRTVIDIDTYSCVNDRFSLIQVDLTEEDLESVEALRNKLNNNGCECDVLVSYESISLEENE